MVSALAAQTIAEIENDNRTDTERKADHEKIRRIQRNRIRRETNQILRDITGTSARAAREDMGLSRS